MNTVLIVDGAAVFCEPISFCLHAAGYHVLSAGDGPEAIQLLSSHKVDLILLDIVLPTMDGFEFLRAIRSQPQSKPPPTIIVSNLDRKDYILQARELGVRDYLLKSQFSLKKLLSRIALRVNEFRQLAAMPPARERLLNMEACLKRVQSALAAVRIKKPAFDMISAALSAQCSAAEFLASIQADADLHQRVLHAAGSPAGPAQSLHAVVGAIGAQSVRNIVITSLLAEVVPRQFPVGFDSRAWWRSALARAFVAQEILDSTSLAASAGVFLAGLCCDLGHIVFHANFGSEFNELAACLDGQTPAGREEVLRTSLGVTPRQLNQLILREMGLPETVRRMLSLYHDEMSNGSGGQIEPQARILRMATFYANALWPHDTNDATETLSFTSAYCRAACGQNHPAPLEAASLRAGIDHQIDMLEIPKSTAREPSRDPVRVFLARDPSLSSLDPLALAISSLCRLTISDHLPRDERDWLECQALVVTTRTVQTPQMTQRDIANLAASRGQGTLPILWLTEPNSASQVRAGSPRPGSWPLTLQQLKQEMQRLLANVTQQSSPQRIAA